MVLVVILMMLHQTLMLISILTSIFITKVEVICILMPVNNNTSMTPRNHTLILMTMSMNTLIVLVMIMHRIFLFIMCIGSLLLAMSIHTNIVTIMFTIIMAKRMEKKVITNTINTNTQTVIPMFTNMFMNISIQEQIRFMFIAIPIPIIRHRHLIRMLINMNMVMNTLQVMMLPKIFHWNMFIFRTRDLMLMNMVMNMIMFMEMNITIMTVIKKNTMTTTMITIMNMVV